MKRKTMNITKRRGQQGFSLIVVFSLVAIMAATAAAVLLSSRTDVKVSGRQRESTLSFFTAEAGVAYAKRYLAGQWNPTTFWTGVLGDSTTNVTYDMGGNQVAGIELPTLKARYTYSFSNNPDDPSLDPTVDQDGRVIITSVGEALDSSGSNVLARTTVQVEVAFGSMQLLKGNYQAMQNQSASGAASSTDLNAVDMSQSTGL
jgi:type II secretory pathway pseudopilin PulG